jgi:hypothetical protein
MEKTLKLKKNPKKRKSKAGSDKNDKFLSGADKF